MGRILVFVGTTNGHTARAFIFMCLGVLRRRAFAEAFAERVPREVPGTGGSPAHGAQVA